MCIYFSSWQVLSRIETCNPSFANDPHLIYNVDEKGFTQNHTAPMAGVVVRLPQVDCWEGQHHTFDWLWKCNRNSNSFFSYFCRQYNDGWFDGRGNTRCCRQSLTQGGLIYNCSVGILRNILNILHTLNVDWY